MFSECSVCVYGFLCVMGNIDSGIRLVCVIIQIIHIWFRCGGVKQIVLVGGKDVEVGER